MAPKTICIVATSNSDLGTTGQKTGCWAEEIMAPILIWKEAGHNIEVASIKGGKIPIDEKSLSDQFRTPEVDKFYASEELTKLIDESLPLASVATGVPFDAVFVPGGHGVMWDMPDNAALHSLLRATYAAGGVIASVCHGPACLVNLMLDDARTYIIKGKQVTGFTNEEESGVGLVEQVPFSLEDKLKEAGADFQKAEAWKPFAIGDGSLVTGQNPQSSKEVAMLVNERLAK